MIGDGDNSGVGVTFGVVCGFGDFETTATGFTEGVGVGDMRCIGVAETTGEGEGLGDVDGFGIGDETGEGVILALGEGLTEDEEEGDGVALALDVTVVLGDGVVVDGGVGEAEYATPKILGSLVIFVEAEAICIAKTKKATITIVVANAVYACK